MNPLLPKSIIIERAPINGGDIIGIIAIKWRNFLKGISVLANVKAKINPTKAPRTAVRVPIIILLKKALLRYQDENTSLKTDRENFPSGRKLVIITLDRG